MRIRSLVLVAILLFGVSRSSVGQTRRALLVGINTYQPAQTAARHPEGCTGGRCDLTALENLEGALNDVAALRELLVSPKFGFRPEDVIVLTDPALPQAELPFVTLPASLTTHDGILAAMRRYLVDEPRRGDTVVFYYAGHGSLAASRRAAKRMHLADGKEVRAEPTLVPSDAWEGGRDVRDQEMTGIFEAALDKGVKLTVLLDTGHRSGPAHGIPLLSRFHERVLPSDPREMREAPGADPRPRPALAGESGSSMLVFTASAEDQAARETPATGSVREAHGAFTAALIAALTVLPADAPAARVAERVQRVLEENGIADQRPALHAPEARRHQPLFGRAPAPSARLRVAVVAVDREGAVELDTGRLAGIGPGTTFTSFATGKSRSVTLKVTDPEGIARSRASVLSSGGGRVTPGEVFELAQWVPAPVDPLRFWTWTGSIPETGLAKAIDAIRAAGIQSVEDPAEEPWTHILLWNSSDWILERSDATDRVELGWKLTAAALREHVPPGARVWVNLPPSQELGGKLVLRAPGSLVEAANNVNQSDYLLVGTLTRNGPAWAWYHRVEFEEGPSLHTPGHSPGCSPASSYPLRTDWVAIRDPAGVPDGAARLSDDAQRLAKVAGWLRLPSSPDAGGADDSHLGLLRAADQAPVAEDQPVRDGEELKLALTSSPRVLAKRWVYVLAIDCRGDGNLLSPPSASAYRFSEREHRIELPGDLTVKPPFGMNTLLLISTSEPLRDPARLNFRSAAGSEETETLSPLEQLLRNASRGTRGRDPGVLPTDWSLTLRRLRSIPRPAP